MDWLVPAVTATFIATLALVFAYTILWRREQEAYLKLWAIGWAAYAFRFVFMLLHLGLAPSPWFLGANQLFSLWSGIILLWGAQVFSGARFPRLWLLGGAALSAWIAAALIFKVGLTWVSLPSFLFQGAVYIWTGIVLLRFKEVRTAEAKIAGWAFIIWGLHKADYPFLRPMQWLAPWGYMLGAILELVVALSIILVYFQRTRSRLERSRRNLEKTQDLFRMVADYTLDWEVWRDPDHKLLYISPSCEAVTGYRSHEFFDNPSHLLAITHPDDRKALDEHIGRHHNETRPEAEIEFRIITRTGESRWIRHVCHPFFDRKGRYAGRRSSNQDITEKKLAQEKLKSSEAFIRAIIESSKDCISTVDTKRVFQSCNPAFEEVFGYSEDEITGKSARLIHPNQKSYDDFGRLVYGRVKQAGYWRGEWDFIDRQGETLQMESVVSAQKDEQGKVFGYVVVHRDISDRKKAEEALRVSEATLATILQAAPMGIGRVTNRILGWCNEHFTKMLGYGKGELEGQSARILYPSDEEFERVGEVKHAEVRERGAGSIETRMITKSGKALEVLLSSAAIDPDDWAKGLVFTTSDITEKKKMEQDRLRLESQLRQAQKMEAVGTLAGGLAHDFNNILGAIVGYTEIALEDAQEGKADPNDLKLVLEASDKARDLVKRILTFSRKTATQLKPLNLNEVIIPTADMLGRVIPRMISIDLDMDPALPLIEGDPAQLEQVLMNLGANARDAMPEGGVLSIITGSFQLEGRREFPDADYAPGRYVFWEVKDTGSGMDPETVEQIFDPFYTTKDVGQGTGLGLSMVFGIVQGHGGRIHCDSAPGGGTTFRIEIPALEEAEREEAELGPQMKTGGGKGETILLVDDEASLLKVNQQVLGRKGYRVLTASSGEQALEVYEANMGQVDLVVLDVSMPGMGGHRCLRELKKMDARAKVLIASGYAPEGQLADILATGAEGFLTKPFHSWQLLNKVRGILDRGPA